jgi:hypothetical protein
VWQHISPEVAVKGFKMCCISVECMGLMMICNTMRVKRDGNVWSECGEGEGTDCEDVDSTAN